MPRDLVVRVMRPKADIPGSIPRYPWFNSCCYKIEVILSPALERPTWKKKHFFMPKQCLHRASAHEQHWWSTKISNPPTHPPKKADTPPWGGGGGTCILPKIRENPDEPTHPPDSPRNSINQSLSYGVNPCLQSSRSWTVG